MDLCINSRYILFYDYDYRCSIESIVIIIAIIRAKCWTKKNITGMCIVHHVQWEKSRYSHPIRTLNVKQMHVIWAWAHIYTHTHTHEKQTHKLTPMPESSYGVPKLWEQNEMNEWQNTIYIHTHTYKHTQTIWIYTPWSTTEASQLAINTDN